MTVSVVRAQGVAWAVLAGRCLGVVRRLPCLKFRSCVAMTLQDYSFGLAAEVDAEAKEKDHASEVGFGFGDGCDFGACLLRVGSDCGQRW